MPRTTMPLKWCEFCDWASSQRQGHAWTDLVSQNGGLTVARSQSRLATSSCTPRTAHATGGLAFAVLNLVDGHLLMPELCMVSALADDCVEWRGELIDVSEF
jgi:hypothetical protein